MSPADRAAFSILFGDDPQLLAALEATCSVCHFKKGATIVQHMDASTEVHYVLSGSAKAYLFSAEGKEVWMNAFQAGSLFGEMAAIANAPRVCSVGAFSDVRTAMFSGKAFLQLMQNQQGVAFAVAKLLAARLHTTSQRLYMAAAESLEGRVIVELAERAQPQSLAAGFTHVIEPVPVIAEIARKVGSARESVSRVITGLCKDGHLLRNKTHWQLKNPVDLLKL